MQAGKAFELLVKQILMHIGFSEVKSDQLYIFDGTAGQMIQGLGDAHNADVLVEPPVQTPFYSPSRLLVECKDYRSPIGLNVLRSALGLREDINHFDIVDMKELNARRSNRRSGIVHDFSRYSYQVAVASMSGFTKPAQNFAATHRIPLIEFNKMPFWHEFCRLAGSENRSSRAGVQAHSISDHDIYQLIHGIASKSAVAITNSGQMLFLFRTSNGPTDFSDYYTLHWQDSKSPWRLDAGLAHYEFQLPKHILKAWLSNSTNELDMKINAIHLKEHELSHMVVYYSDDYGMPQVKMISINRYALADALKELQ